MANEEQYHLLLADVGKWNSFRIEHPDVLVDLSGADLRNAELKYADLHGANLNRANLFNANLHKADLREADLSHAILDEAQLYEADMYKVNLSNASLRHTDLREALLPEAVLKGSDLTLASLFHADLFRADLTGAILVEANLIETDLTKANLRSASLYKSRLRGARLVETDLCHANLTGSEVFGISAWKLNLEGTIQDNLVITNKDEAVITVDNLQVAQFIYLLVNNEMIRNVIDTVTSKTVLILGRFTQERKPILDNIREELRRHNYVPVLFDFEKPQSQNLLETVMTLAGMARFIIADVTAATMVREEIRSVVEKFPSKPIQPLLLQGEVEPVTLLEMQLSYKNILQTFKYRNAEEVIFDLTQRIILPAEAWINRRKDQHSGAGKTDREVELEKEIERLKRQIEQTDQ
jgi:uncharacterized protein YjbI with pentapeptide repeats